MQFLYAYSYNHLEGRIIEKNMLYSIDKINDLYLSLLNLLIALRNVCLKKLDFFDNKKASSFKKEDSLYEFLLKFSSNKLLYMLSENSFLKEFDKNNMLLSWGKHQTYLSKFFNDFIKQLPSNSYVVSSNKHDFKEDKEFIVFFYKSYLSLHPKLDDWVKEQYFTWIEDVSIAHFMVINTFNFIKEDSKEPLRLYRLYKNQEDKDFLIDLFRKTLAFKDEFDELIKKVSKKWDIKRIAPLDLIILEMALCEFIYFPHIPPRVTLNEYIEIAKIYSTQKSQLFINGILDELLKSLTLENKIIKTERGLL